MTYMSEKKKYHILIADDERELCVLMAELIESELVHCSKAYSGEGALARQTRQIGYTNYRFNNAMYEWSSTNKKDA